MDQKSKLIFTSMALILLGASLGLVSYFSYGRSLIFSLVVLFFSIFSVFLGINILIWKLVLKK
jgi:hypothetical protein